MSQAENRQPHSMTWQFRRDYLMVSIVPLLLLFVLIVGGLKISRDYLADLILQSTQEVNSDAEHHLQGLGERILLNKARDVAKQLDLYFRMHPGQAIEEMREDPLFMDIALQKVGKTGYTAVYESVTCIFRVHPNVKLIDQDMSHLADDLPTWWAIVGASLSGKEVSGYYDWLEPDGSVRQKYMCVTPVGQSLQGITMIVAATSYIDEFSTPIINMRKKSRAIVEEYQTYVSQQGILFGLTAIVILFLTFAGTYLLGRRASVRYLLPITQLSETVQQFGTGSWDITHYDEVRNRSDEIGVLANTFTRMSFQLKDLFERLERRVAELKKTKAALEDSEDHYRRLYEESQQAGKVYRSLIQSSADAIMIYDMAGEVTYVSPMFSETFGWSARELNQDAGPFLPESERVRTLEILTAVNEQGIPHQGFETKRTSKEGHLIEVSISASRYDDHQGAPAGVLVLLRDISEKKRLEAQLQHIERMEAIGTLAGGIAHDFNNLLMAVQGYVSLMRYDMDPDHPHYQKFVKIEQQIQRGSKLTSQLLGYARKGKYEVKALDLNEILSESAETFSRTRKEITLHKDLTADLAPIEADVYQIEQVLMNLFINASDAMLDGGDLYLHTQNISPGEMLGSAYAPKPGEYVMLSVKDTGVGMDRKTMDRIFDPFFTTKEMGRGTGLGLASVYGIVKGHGGYIDVDSQEGQGTVFNIYLPASRKSVGAPLQDEASTAVPGKGTILMIDDEEVVLDVGVGMMEALGYEVIPAEGGRQAIELYQRIQDRVDLVVLDMIMPDVSGRETFDALRRINPEAKVLLATGYSIDGKATEIIDQGCNGFIQKPYTMEAMADKIQEILS